MSTTTMPHLASLGAYRSAGEMREALAARQPAFAASRLRELAVIGAADEGRRLVALCEGHGITVRAIADDDPMKHEMPVGRLRVAPVQSLDALDRTTPIVIASHRVMRGAERLRGMGFSQVAPFALLEVLDPARFPPHMFYEGLLDDLWANRDRYVRLVDLLMDDRSRQVLDAVIGFRLTLDAEWLRPVIEENLYAPPGLFTYGQDKVYVDAGAYDGDTIRLFIERVGGRFSRILAFEPDQSTYERLAANFAAEKRVEPLQMGLHRQKGTMHLASEGSRASRLVEHGGVPVAVVGLDDILDGDPVSAVKMNIEGAEIEALWGAARSIKQWSPKLLIAAYHRPSDLWQVPATVHEIQPGYRLFLRQHDGGVIETVLYALA